MRQEWEAHAKPPRPLDIFQHPKRDPSSKGAQTFEIAHESTSLSGSPSVLIGTPLSLAFSLLHQSARLDLVRSPAWVLKQSRGTCKVAAKAWVASGCGQKAEVCICRPLRTRRTNDGRSARFPASKTRTFSIVWPSASKRGREVVEHPGGSIKQWIKPRRLLDVRPRQRARRVQPDRARLQFSPRAQHPWRQGLVGRGSAA